MSQSTPTHFLCKAIGEATHTLYDKTFLAGVVYFAAVCSHLARRLFFVPVHLVGHCNLHTWQRLSVLSVCPRVQTADCTKEALNTPLSSSVLSRRSWPWLHCRHLRSPDSLDRCLSFVEASACRRLSGRCLSVFVDVFSPSLGCPPKAPLIVFSATVVAVLLSVLLLSVVS